MKSDLYPVQNQFCPVDTLQAIYAFFGKQAHRKLGFALAIAIGAACGMPFFGLALPDTSLLSGRMHSVLLAQSPIAVTSTDATLSKDGLCTLPEAIANANQNEKVHVDCASGSGKDTIVFKIPGPGPHTIYTQKGLPLVITEAVYIDGMSQRANGVSPPSCGKNRNLMIVLNGSYASDSAGITVLNTKDVKIRGLTIAKFAGSGIQVRGSENVHILCNHIGTDITGESAVPNKVSGVQLANNSRFVTIGTDGDGSGDALEFNVISGNGAAGILVNESHNNVIAGNRIGTNTGGINALPNDGHGIMIGNGSERNRIGTNSDGVGDGAERNIISGNQTHGITVSDVGTKKTVIAGNYIGTNIFGSYGLPNMVAGINISNGSQDSRIGGRMKSDTNIISGNKSRGIWIHSTYTDFVNGAEPSNTMVQNNVIGLGVNRKPLGNKNHGVLASLASNVQLLDNIIAQNLRRGVLIVGAEALIVNNRISSNGLSGIEITFHPGKTRSVKDELAVSDDVVSSIQVIGNIIDGNCKATRRCAGIMGIDDSVDPGDSTKGKTIARANIIKENNGHPDVAQFWYAVVKEANSVEPSAKQLSVHSSHSREPDSFHAIEIGQTDIGVNGLFGPKGFTLANVSTWNLFLDFEIDEDGTQIEHSYRTDGSLITTFASNYAGRIDYAKRGLSRSGILSNTHVGYQKANNRFSLLRYKILTFQAAVDNKNSAENE